MISLDGYLASAAWVTVSPTHGPLRDRLLGGPFCFHTWASGDPPVRQGGRGWWIAHPESVSMGCNADTMSNLQDCSAQQQLLEAAPTVRLRDWGLTRGWCQIRRFY